MRYVTSFIIRLTKRTNLSEFLSDRVISIYTKIKTFLLRFQIESHSMRRVVPDDLQDVRDVATARCVSGKKPCSNLRSPTVRLWKKAGQESSQKAEKLYTD